MSDNDMTDSQEESLEEPNETAQGEEENISAEEGESQNSEQEQEISAEGESESSSEEDDDKSFSQKDLEFHIDKRLKTERRRHERVVNRMQLQFTEAFQGNPGADSNKTESSELEEAVAKTLSTIEQKKQEQQQKAASAQKQTEWQAKIDDALDKHDDYVEVVQGALNNGLITSEMEQAAALIDDGPDFMYKLATNHKDRLSEIAKLPTQKQIVKLIQLEAEMRSADDNKVKSKAPPPIKTIKSNNGGAAITRDPAKQTFEQMVEELRNKNNR